jgi:beta-lysine 5,6-aminomutase alpha subunit
MTEGIHTPFLADRDLALENVRYVRQAAGRLGDSFRPEPDGFVARRAREVLAEAVGLLRRIGDEGLLTAIADGTFGVTRRPPDGGRGLDGVIERAERYVNPATDILDGVADGSGDFDDPERDRGSRPGIRDVRPVEAS